MPGLVTAFGGDAWGDTLARFRPLLRLLAARSFNPRYWRQVDPSDLVQKTMAEAHQKRDDFRGSSEKELLAWLKQILGLRIIDEARRLRCGRNDVDREVEVARAEEQVRSLTSPLTALVRHEEALRLAEALEKLPPDERRAIELIHFQGLTLAETAELMGKTRHAVARLLRPAQARLRELMRDTR